MYERFTERARQVVVLAQEEARKHRDPEITVRHILLGLLREEAGVAAQVLTGLGVDEGAERAKLGQVGSKEIEGSIPVSAEAKKALEIALREALSLGHNYIGTEHILLGLLRVAPEVLEGLTDSQVREAVQERLWGPRRQKALASIAPTNIRTPTYDKPRPPRSIRLWRIGLEGARDTIDRLLKELS